MPIYGHIETAHIWANMRCCRRPNSGACALQIVVLYVFLFRASPTVPGIKSKLDGYPRDWSFHTLYAQTWGFDLFEDGRVVRFSGLDFYIPCARTGFGKA